MISEKDRARLRELAKETVELAHTPHMDKLRQEWLDHNMLRGKRPMVVIEIGTFAGNILPDMLQCEGDEARGIEWGLLQPLVQVKDFKDDTVLNDFYSVPVWSWFNAWGIDVEVEKVEGQPDSLGHHFVEKIHDLDEDMHLFGKSKYGIDLASVDKTVDYYNELFDGIMPAKKTGMCQILCPTQELVHIMSMQDMFMSIYDCPEKFKEIFEKLSNDHFEHWDLLEKEGAIMPTRNAEWLGQGTYCFNDELADEADAAKRHLTTQDTWLYMDSQESVGLSPEMFDEFIWPIYEKAAQRFGLVSYGCCEPVSDFWKSVGRLKNLRKVSISPWCDEEFMGEQLRDPARHTIFHRKPSPNILGVGKEMDEEYARKHIAKTIRAARGVSLEFTQRDVYTIEKNIPKVARFVEIIREESEKHIK